MSHLLGSLAASLLLLAPPAALAQEEHPPTVKPEPEPEVLLGGTGHDGGWGAPVAEVTTVRDRAAVLLGGRGGWLLDGRLTLGGGGFALVTPVPAPPGAGKPGELLELQMGYGGVWVEYTISPLRLLHASVGTLIGGGGVSLNWQGGGSYGSGTSFFVTEPAVVAELNLAKHVRLDVGGAYRWIFGARMAGLSSADVAGFSALVAVKFGKF